MAINAESGSKPAVASSKDELKTIVSTTDFGVIVKITDFSDGSHECSLGDVTVEDSNKNPAHDVPAAPSQKDVPVSAALVPGELPDGKTTDCSACTALLKALREQVSKSTPVAPAPRRFPLSVGRRFGKS